MLLNYIHPSHYFNNQQIGVKCPIPLKLRQLNRISIEIEADKDCRKVQTFKPKILSKNLAFCACLNF